VTAGITRYIAVEGRVYSVAVGGPLSPSDDPADLPMREEIAAEYPALGLRHSDEQHVQTVGASSGPTCGPHTEMRGHVEATASYVRGFLE
jgi:hypothetical protein